MSTSFIQYFSSAQLDVLKASGSISNNKNEAGSYILNMEPTDISSYCISVPMKGYTIDEKYINSIENVAITEIKYKKDVPVDENKNYKSLYEMAANENQELLTTLNKIVEESMVDTEKADEKRLRDTIISLRRQLGQGYVDSDFSIEFPYEPVSK